MLPSQIYLVGLLPSLDTHSPYITLTVPSLAVGKLDGSAPFCFKFNTAVSLVASHSYGDVLANCIVC